jgi:hypothetical protein
MSGVAGAGAGFTGSLGIMGGVGAGARGSAGAAATVSGSAVSAMALSFSNAPVSGVQSRNPITGTSLTVSQPVAAGLGAVLGGQSSGSGATALTNGLTAGGSLSNDLAAGLVQALAGLGSAPSLPALKAAVTAYNVAVNGLTGTAPPALFAVQNALSGLMR